MSCRPQAFAPKLPAGAVLLWSHWLPQSRQLALLTPISSPQLYAVSVPARAAYSHSGLAQQPIRLPRLPRQPLHVALGVVPTHDNHRTPTASPSILRDVLAPWTAPVPRTRVPLRERHLVPAHRERRSDGHLVYRAPVVVAHPVRARRQPPPSPDTPGSRAPPERRPSRRACRTAFQGHCSAFPRPCPLAAGRRGATRPPRPPWLAWVTAPLAKRASARLRVNGKGQQVIASPRGCRMRNRIARQR